MTLKNHKLITGPNVHVVHNWAYADAATRVAATGFVTSDLHKLSLQEDNNSMWQLIGISPTVWKLVSGAGGSDEDAIHDNVAGEINAITEKVTPVAADLVLIEDSADTYSKKKVQLGSVSHTLLADKGTNTHSQIDSHIASTSNPHSVTKTQVGLSDVTNDAQLKRAAGDFATFTEKTSPVGADLVLIEDSEATNAKKKVQRSNFLPVFGTQYQKAASEGESSTTLDSYQQKLRLTTPSLPAGDYHVQWYAEVVTSDASKGIITQVQQDDTTVLMESHADHNGTYAQGFWYSIAGHAVVTLTAASHTFDFDYKSEFTPKTAYIRRVRLEIWRVS